MSRAMYRYEVQVDDQPHPFFLTSGPVHVAAPSPNVVEFWAENRGDEDGRQRAFQVFGTGQPLPDFARWVGTCDRTPGGLVWHLYEVGA